MANWFPMALKDSAFSWLTNLPAESINTWEELCRCFVANFKGTYERGLTYNDLRAVHQKLGETLRKYIQRFSQVRNKTACSSLQCYPSPTPTSTVAVACCGLFDSVFSPLPIP